MNRYDQCLDLLLEHTTHIENPLSRDGSILQVLCGEGCPPTQDLVYMNCFEYIYIKLVNAGACPNGHPSATRLPPLYTAIKMENEVLISVLLEHDADPTLCFRNAPKDASIFARSFPPCSIFVEGLFMFHFHQQRPSPLFTKFLLNAYTHDPVSFTHITELIFSKSNIAEWIRDSIRKTFPRKSHKELSTKDRLAFFITHHCPHELEMLIKANPNVNLESVRNTRMIVNGHKPKSVPGLILAGEDMNIIKVLVNAGAQIKDTHPTYASEYCRIRGLLDHITRKP